MGAGRPPQETLALPETFDLLLKGGTVVSHAGEGVVDIGVRDGRIASIGAIAKDRAAETIDAAGLHILPGVIDTQVHFREPGMEHKEDLASGSWSAVLGGVTAVFEMPNTKPATTSEAALADKVARATGRMHCDFAFFVGCHAREYARACRARAPARRRRHQGVHGVIDRRSPGRG